MNMDNFDAVKMHNYCSYSFFKIHYTAKYYNHKVKTKEHVFWELYNDKEKKLDDNYSLLRSILSGKSGSHTMSECWYKYYSKTSG